MLIVVTIFPENRIASRDKTHHRMGREAFDLYLRNQLHSLPIKLQPAKLDEFTALYRHARHEPKVRISEFTYSRKCRLIDYIVYG